MKLARLVAVAGVSLVVLGACGKRGGTSQLGGLYLLADPSSRAGGLTSLELDQDGTYVVRRESPPSIGALDCGRWKTETAGTAHLVKHEGTYWPTPDRYPSALVERIAFAERDGVLLVTGESEWAGTFTQRWERGGHCNRCEPLPACTRVD